MLLVAEDDQILGQPAQMDHVHRAGKQERRSKVTIRRRVDAIRHDARETKTRGEPLSIDGVIGAGDRTGTKGHRVCFPRRPSQSLVVATERRDVREEKMRDQNGHRSTKMRVGRHDCISRRLRFSRKRSDDGRHLLLKERDLSPQVQAKIEGYLFVARTASMKTLAEVSYTVDKLPLNEGVNIFVRAVDE